MSLLVISPSPLTSPFRPTTRLSPSAMSAVKLWAPSAVDAVRRTSVPSAFFTITVQAASPSDATVKIFSPAAQPLAGAVTRISGAPSDVPALKLVTPFSVTPSSVPLPMPGCAAEAPLRDTVRTDLV